MWHHSVENSGMDVNTGIFTVAQPGIYQVSVWWWKVEEHDFQLEIKSHYFQITFTGFFRSQNGHMVSLTAVTLVTSSFLSWVRTSTCGAKGTKQAQSLLAEPVLRLMRMALQVCDYNSSVLIETIFYKIYTWIISKSVHTEETLCRFRRHCRFQSITFTLESKWLRCTLHIYLSVTRFFSSKINGSIETKLKKLYKSG